MKIFKAIVALVLFILIFIIFIQNTETIPFKFFFWEVNMSRIVLLVLSLLSGLIIGFILGSLKFGKSK